MFPTKDQVALTRDLEYEAIKFVMDVYDVHKLDAQGRRDLPGQVRHR